MRIFIVILLLISATSYARDFTNKDIVEWQIAPMGAISSFTRLGDTFYELPIRKAYYYDVKYNPKASSGDLAFGDTRSLSAGMTRHDFDENLFKQYLWADISVHENKLIFVDSWNYRVFYRDLKTNNYSRNGDIIIDQTRPAEDSRGAAPPSEVSNSRYRFKKSFKALHPGGKIGKKLRTLSEIMDADLPLIKQNSSILDAVLEMTKKKYGCAVIIGNQKEIKGIITDGDLRRAIKKLDISDKAIKIMSKKPVTATGDLLISSAITLMNKNSITSLLITKKNIPLGIVNLKTCLENE